LIVGHATEQSSIPQRQMAVMLKVYHQILLHTFYTYYIRLLQNLTTKSWSAKRGSQYPKYNDSDDVWKKLLKQAFGHIPVLVATK
jgi:hypothetical protein